MGVTIPEEPEVMPEKPKVTKDLMQMFPDLKKKEDCIAKPTLRKLKEDEKHICKALIKKYGPENHSKMAHDIKVNYLQWSKGQCAKNIELYRISTGEIKAEYKQ